MKWILLVGLVAIGCSEPPEGSFIRAGEHVVYFRNGGTIDESDAIWALENCEEAHFDAGELVECKERSE